MPCVVLLGSISANARMLSLNLSMVNLLRTYRVGGTTRGTRRRNRSQMSNRILRMFVGLGSRGMGCARFGSRCLQTLENWQEGSGNNPTRFVPAARVVTAGPCVKPNRPLSQSKPYKALKKFGVRGAFHGFRRYRTTILRAARCPEDLIRAWIGHSAVSQTDRYSKLGSGLLEVRKD